MYTRTYVSAYVCMYVMCVCMYVCVYMSVCFKSVCLFVCLSVCLSVCLPVCLSVHLSVCLSVCLYCLILYMCTKTLHRRQPRIQKVSHILTLSLRMYFYCNRENLWCVLENTRPILHDIIQKLGYLIKN